MKKVILMVFLIFSLLMIVYGIGFILNYYLVIKYSIEDCLPLGGKGTFPVVSDRLDEIHALVNYAEIVKQIKTRKAALDIKSRFRIYI